MVMGLVDLTGGEVKILGNRNDVHTIRLTNPIDQDAIASGGVYSVEFTSAAGVLRVVTADVTQISEGILSFPLIVEAGTYRVRRMNPRRTLVTIQVEVR